MSAIAPKPIVFVYGTLRQGCRSGAHQRYLQGAEFLGYGHIGAQLFRVSDYPALCLNDTARRVKGEVYSLRDQAQLQQLDDYEECPEPWHAAQEYRREQLAIQLDTGALITAWVYIYQGSTAALEPIVSGDFLHPDGFFAEDIEAFVTPRKQ